MKLLTLILFILSIATASYPGIRSSINISALNGLKSKYLPKLIAKITASDLPPKDFSFNFLLIPAKLTLSNITVTDFNINQNATSFNTSQSENTILLTFANVSCTVTADFKYHYPITTSGEVTIQFSDVSIQVPMKMDIKKGEFVAIIEKARINEDLVTVKFIANSGMANFFGNIFEIWPIKNIAQHIYKSSLEKISLYYNTDLQNLLGSINYTNNYPGYRISNDFHIFELQTNNQDIQLLQNGTFFPTYDEGQLNPVVPPNILPNFVSPNALRIQLTEYFFDTLAWSVFASGSLNFYIKSETIPSSFPYVFTTSGLSKIIPNFSTIYGPNLPVDLDCSVYKIPDMSIQSTVDIYASIYCDVMVRVAPTASVAAFRLLAQLQSSFSGSLQVVDSSLYLFGELDQENSLLTNYAVVNSNMGTFNINGLVKALNFYTYYLVLQANKKLGDVGILLPIPAGITFKQANLYTYAGAVEIGGEPILV
ncbi:hypothetical protein SteCoe_20619 [Stentor coeruleus]|uniref:Lipid-binding serum glycoprotein C-terminal domain-containing protein n=1 Tax=Stentor coeruleus TaxID=5963 RepID=A0A1R2BRE4_9CILI|nr:hypothetical protein SteCoe_20619 [Stentor coeruleus]